MDGSLTTVHAGKSRILKIPSHGCIHSDHFIFGTRRQRRFANEMSSDLFWLVFAEEEVRIAHLLRQRLKFRNVFIPPRRLQQLVHLLIVKTSSKGFRRNAGRDRVRRNVFCYDGSGCNDRSVANRHSIKNDAFGPDPNVMADRDSVCFFKSAIMRIALISLMVWRVKERMRRNEVSWMAARPDENLHPN